MGVYTNLLCVSRSHLRAFVKRLGQEDYETPGLVLGE